MSKKAKFKGSFCLHLHRPKRSLICHTSPLAAVSVFSGGAGRDVASVFADTVEATKRIATAHQFQG